MKHEKGSLQAEPGKTKWESQSNKERRVRGRGTGGAGEAGKQASREAGINTVGQLLAAVDMITASRIDQLAYGLAAG